MNSMRPLRLDHQAREGEARRRAMTVMLLLAIACNIGGGFYYADLGNQRQAAEQAAARPAKVATRRTTQTDTVQSDLASLPWDDVFGAIEAAGTADVSLLSLDPTPDKRMLKLQAEARNMEAVLAYLRALAGTTVFSQVSLQSHQVQQADPLHPVRFLVLLEWRSGS
jgi:Tfp pilus assembly protein PilN